LAKVYLALGSNLENPVRQLNQALQTLEKLSTTPIIHSDFYKSKALGPQSQPDYINAVALIQTQGDAFSLLRKLQKIEDNQGRNRKTERWGARTLDLDILLYDQLTLDTPSLTIPHKEMLKRAFVLYPLYEIAPKLILPNQTDIKSTIDKLDQAGLNTDLQRTHLFNEHK